MNPEILSTILGRLICLLPFCFLGVAGLVMMALMAWVFQRVNQPKSDAEQARETQKMRAKVDSLMEKLRPWSADNLSDLSTDWDATWTKFMRLEVKGTIPGLSKPKEGAWVAFNLNIRAAGHLNGRLLARTTAQTFFYQINPKEGVTIEVDDAPWGNIQPDGTLVDAAGHVIGNMLRPSGTPTGYKWGAVTRIRDEREREYPVTLHGQVIAQLANPGAKLLGFASLKEGQFPPAITLNNRPSEEEATWLLALAILQVAGYNTMESVGVSRKR